MNLYKIQIFVVFLVFTLSSCSLVLDPGEIKARDADTNDSSGHRDTDPDRDADTDHDDADPDDTDPDDADIDDADIDDADVDDADVPDAEVDYECPYDSVEGSCNSFGCDDCVDDSCRGITMFYYESSSEPASTIITEQPPYDGNPCIAVCTPERMDCMVAICFQTHVPMNEIESDSFSESCQEMLCPSCEDGTRCWATRLSINTDVGWECRLRASDSDNCEDRVAIGCSLVQPEP